MTQNGGDKQLNYTNLRSSSRGLTICVLPVFIIIAIFEGCSSESKGPKYEIFPPAGGKGAIVVVASGYSGPGLTVTSVQNSQGLATMPC